MVWRAFAAAVCVFPVDRRIGCAVVEMPGVATSGKDRQVRFLKGAARTPLSGTKQPGTDGIDFRQYAGQQTALSSSEVRLPRERLLLALQDTVRNISLQYGQTQVRTGGGAVLFERGHTIVGEGSSAEKF